MSKARKVARTSVKLKKEKKPINYKHAVLIATAAFAAAVIILASVLGIVGAVKQSGYLLYYSGVGMDEGVVNYFSAAYKTAYLRNINGKTGRENPDTEAFWQSKNEDGVTYGEDLKAKTLIYLKSIIAANAVFNSYSRITATDRAAIDKAIADKLTAMGGSVSEFNKRAERYGFDYSDMRVCAEMLYKFNYAEGKIFGADGANAALFPDKCQQFLESYSRVFLVFVRDKDKLVTDEKGAQSVVDKTPEELAKVEEALAALRATVTGLNADTTAPERYFELQGKYDEGDKNYHTEGYFFKEGTSVTKDFEERFPELVSAALSLEVGKACEVSTSIGPCFIYRSGVALGAYLEMQDNKCLKEFYPLAAKFIYGELLAEVEPKVELRSKWTSAEPALIPKTTDFVVRFE